MVQTTPGAQAHPPPAAPRREDGPGQKGESEPLPGGLQGRGARSSASVSLDITIRHRIRLFPP